MPASRSPSCSRPRAATAVALLVAVALAPLAATPAGAQTDAVAALTSLGTDDFVDVSVDGLEPNATVFLVLCNPGSDLVDYQAQCSLIGSGAAGYEVDADGTLGVIGVAVPSGPVGTIDGATCPTSPADAEEVEEEVVCRLVVVDENLRPLASAALDEIDGNAIALTPEPPSALAETGAAARTGLLAAIGLAFVVVGGVSLGAARRTRPAPSGPRLYQPLILPADIWAVATRSPAIGPDHTGTPDITAEPMAESDLATVAAPIVWTPWTRPGHEEPLLPRHRRQVRSLGTTSG